MKQHHDLWGSLIYVVWKPHNYQGNLTAVRQPHVSEADSQLVRLPCKWRASSQLVNSITSSKGASWFMHYKFEAASHIWCKHHNKNKFLLLEYTFSLTLRHKTLHRMNDISKNLYISLLHQWGLRNHIGSQNCASGTKRYFFHVCICCSRKLRYIMDGWAGLCHTQDLNEVPQLMFQYRACLLLSAHTSILTL